MATRSRRRKEQEEEGEQNFVKSLEFRKHRGGKIKALLDKKQNGDDSDDFWANNKYFGSFNDVMNESEDSEDYSKEASIPDVFDEDFEETSEDSEEEGEEEQPQRASRSKLKGIEAPSKSLRASKYVEIQKKEPANVKKFVEKDDEKPKLKPAIAALKKKKQLPTKKSKQPLKQIKNVTFAMETPESTPVKQEVPPVKAEPPVQQGPLRSLRLQTKYKAQAEVEAQAQTQIDIEPEEPPSKNRASTKSPAQPASKAQPKTKQQQQKPSTPVQTLQPQQQIKTPTPTKGKAKSQTPPKYEAPPKPETPSKTKAPPKTPIKPTTSSKAQVKPQAAIETPPQTNSSQQILTRGHDKRISAQKIVPETPTPKSKLKTKSNQKQKDKAQTKNEKKETIQTPKKKGKYIHDFLTQEDLMKEAALTEIYNKKSLESLLQLETDKKDSYLIIRRLKIEDSRVKFISKKVDGKEQESFVTSDKEAYNLYFGGITSSATNLKKRAYHAKVDKEEIKGKDTEEVISKRLFLTNSEFKLAEMDRNIKKLESEEDRVKKTIDMLKGILDKKYQALQSLE